MRGATDPAGPVVYKFGGSSVGDAARIRHVAGLVAAAETPPVVVVSAVAGVTDRLSALARRRGEGQDVSDELRAVALHHRTLAEALLADTPVLLQRVAGEIDAVVDDLLDETRAPLPGSAEDGDRLRALGEDLSTRLLAGALEARRHPVRRVDARDVIPTDARFGAAEPREGDLARAARQRILPALAAGEVVVVQGFVGRAPDGRTTTLGRGGSDWTASLLGAALEAREVHIWTDVDGILSGDPRAVAAPRRLDRIGYEEAVELAYFGAKVLHPGAAKHAVSRGLAVRIRSTFAPDRPGTLILRERWEPAGVAAVAFKPGVVLIQVRSHPSAMPYGFLARVFEVLTRHKLPVDLVATSHTSTAFTLDAGADVDRAAGELEVFADVTVRADLATVSVVGYGLLDEPGIVGRVFAVVGSTPVHLVSQASDVSLSFVVGEADAPALVERLHAELVEPRPVASEVAR